MASPWSVKLSRGLRATGQVAKSAWMVGFLTLHVATLSWSADHMGRRVVDVLEDLRREGLVFIFNDQIVGNELRVLTQPTASEGVELARQIVGEHGLSLMTVAPNTYAITRGDSIPREPSVASDAVPLDEVVVFASRYDLTNAPNAPVVFAQHELQDLPRLGDETLRALDRLPGTAGNGFSSVGAIRGGAPNEMGIVLDGMRLHEPFHLKNFLSPVSLLDARVVESMEVYAGAFPAQYGDRMSAIVEAKSVQPSAPAYYELGLSAFHLSGLASAELGGEGAPWRGLVAVRRSNLSELSKLSRHDFGRPGYSDGYARVDYQFNDRMRAALHVLLSRDKVVARRQGGAQRAEAEYRNNYVWASLQSEFESADLQVLAGITDVTNDRVGAIDNPGLRSVSVADLRKFQIGNVRADVTLHDAGGESIEQRFGVEARDIAAKYRYSSDLSIAADYPFPGMPARQTQRRAALEPEGYEYSAYWDARIDIKDRWALQGGIRVDNQEQYGFGHATQWSPRLSVLYAPTRATHLRASWGRFAQAQGVNELQVEDGVDFFYPPQRADHLIVGIDQSFSERYLLRFEVYRKSYRRLQPRFENLYNSLLLLPEAEYDRVRIAPRSARAEGAELMLSARSSGAWSGWASYAWSRARDQIWEEGQYRNVPRSWDQTHAINAGLMWSSRAWVATIANFYRTGWPTSQLTLPDGGPPQNGPRNAKRFAPYYSLDVRLSYTASLTRGKLDSFLEVTNATNRQNPCCTRYSTGLDAAGNSVLEGLTDHWLGIVPSVGVLWRY